MAASSTTVPSLRKMTSVLSPSLLPSFSPSTRKSSMLLRVRARVRVRVRVREKVSASSEWGGEAVNGEGTWSAGRGSGKGNGG